MPKPGKAWKPTYWEITRVARATRMKNFERSKAARAAVGAMPEPLPAQPKKGRAISAARVREERLKKRNRRISSASVTPLTASSKPRKHPKPVSEAQALAAARRLSQKRATKRKFKTPEAYGPRNDIMSRGRRLHGSFESGQRR